MQIRLKLCQSLAVTTLIGALPTMTHGQTALIDSPQAPNPIERRQQMEELIGLASAFLESPDSGVWSSAADTFKNAAATFDPLGELQVRYHRFYNGLQLLGASVKLSVSPNGAVSFNYPPKAFRAPKNLAPKVPETKVWRIVAGLMKVDQARLAGEAQLALLPNGAADARLVWRVHAFHPAAASMKFYLDARTGEVVHRENGSVEDVVGNPGRAAYRR